MGMVAIMTFSAIPLCSVASGQVYADDNYTVTNGGGITASPIDSSGSSGGWGISDSGISSTPLDSLESKTILLCSPYPLYGKEIYFYESDYPNVDIMEYGCQQVTGATKAGAAVSVTVNNATYSGVADSQGSFAVAVPLLKVGTTLSVKFNG